MYLRDLSGNTVASLLLPIVSPVFLVELGYSPPIRLSSREQLTFDGNTFISSGVSVAPIKYSADLGFTTTLRIPNNTNVFTPVFLNTGIIDKTCRIYQTYDTNLGTSDVQLIFSGHITKAEFSPGSVTLSAGIGDYSEMFSPRIFCAPPLCNYIPPPGTIIYFGGEAYEVE